MFPPTQGRLGAFLHCDDSADALALQNTRCLRASPRKHHERLSVALRERNVVFKSDALCRLSPFCGRTIATTGMSVVAFLARGNIASKWRDHEWDLQKTSLVSTRFVGTAGWRHLNSSLDQHFHCQQKRGAPCSVRRRNPHPQPPQ